MAEREKKVKAGKKKRRTRTQHSGVVLTSRSRRGRTEHWARWTDPITGEQLSCRLDMGLSRAEDRTEWAKTKAKSLQMQKLKVSAGHIVRTKTNLGDAVEKYFASAGNRLRDLTITAYKASVKEFTEWAKGKITYTEEITGPHLMEFRDSLMAAKRLAPAADGKRGERRETDETRKPTSINRTLRAVKTLLNDWRTRGFVPLLNRDAITDSLKLVSAGRPRPEYLPPEAVKKLLAACIRHDNEIFVLTRNEKLAGLLAGHGSTPRYEPIAPLVAFLLTTGCRIGEALNLRWADANLDALDENGKVVGEIVLLPTATKTATERAIDLSVSPACRAVLSALKLKRNPSDEFVFGGKKPLPGSRVEAARKRLIKTYDAPEFTWQKLRQSCGTYLTNAPGIFGAASAYRSARQLGHSVAIAERHYLGLVRGIPRDAHTVDDAMQAGELLQKIVARINGNADENRTVGGA